MLTGRPARRGYDALTVADQLADDTSEYTKSDNRLMLHAALAQLPPRQRDIVTRRFVDELTQSQIAAKIGVPQMHVSRLLRSTLEQLRHHVV
ncbi:sigma-70 family RNA polymerase sigma factor [Amycolatopsis sp. NPDC051371]|uniref:sigma-70 family RNA polymerase sigma factor n=1 Tax=Amycolatopsis sp. NPDC051371 TaxID=3155800 RepID=UPI00342A73C9